MINVAPGKNLLGNCKKVFRSDNVSQDSCKATVYRRRQYDGF